MDSSFSVPIAHAAGVITDATPIAKILTNVLGFLLSIVGGVAIIGLIVASVMYLTAFGDRERIVSAKRAMMASVIGIIVALGAWVLVSQLAVFFS